MIITRHTLKRLFALFMLLTTRNKETSARYGANSVSNIRAMTPKEQKVALMKPGTFHLQTLKRMSHHIDK